MKLHIVTVGEPHLAYARAGWDEYFKRLGRYHQLRVTHVADKYAYDPKFIANTIGSAYKVILEITGQQFTSHELAEIESREVCFVIGGPEGLPQEIRQAADLQWSFSRLTFPHDLAMVILLESIYRAATINANHPYHK
jgi:23S rRNA (pseudouridine1915-N3)-methyltransferase